MSGLNAVKNIDNCMCVWHWLWQSHGKTAERDFLATPLQEQAFRLAQGLLYNY